jgi:hypothetical protein
VFPQTKKNLRVRGIKGEKHDNKQRKRVRTRERDTKTKTETLLTRSESDRVPVSCLEIFQE